MCGFVGFLRNTGNELEEQEKESLEKMTNLITHRGPDDEGYFADQHIRFGFRRLSIIDIEQGKQPLSYENDRYWIVFNGEIYNYIELRDDLIKDGYHFNTESDTEVIISLYAQKGVAAFDELRGMFAFLIWDKEEQEMVGVRDPFGIKPFYYMETEQALYCASERKSLLLAHTEQKIDYEALQHYLTYQYVPEPFTLSTNIKKLEPGQYIQKKVGQKATIQSYWHPTFSINQTPSIHIKEQADQIYNTLLESVQLHMRSDVPVGSFLSGGIDSTSIVALAKEFHPSIQTFTVGFEREGYSEIDLAKDTAADLGVENIEYVVQADEFMAELPKIIYHMDDPVADPAAIPLYFVAREASKHVKVVLSGEGADELFGGYTIYNEPNSLKLFSYIPNFGKSLLRRIASLIPEGTRGKSFLERGSMSLEERYIGNAKMFLENEKANILHHYDQSYHYQQITQPIYDSCSGYDDITKMQYVDMQTWLRGDILVKADRMTMAHSLELRVPFLDKKVFEVASKLHPSQKITQGTTKFLLREAMKKVVPSSVYGRRKLGFPVPIRHWLKKEMYDWAESLILESNTDHLFHREKILQLLQDHRAGKLDHSRKIWTVLIFMIWHQIYIEGKNPYHSATDPS